MAALKAVKEAGPDPKAGKPKARSSVEFPYYDLDTSIAVAKTIHERAGGVCDRPQLAAYLNYSSPTNGSFLTRVAAAKMYGVIEQADDGLRVSDRGRAIIAPVTPSGKAFALIEAFLAVELFQRVYDQFKGTTLPEQAGLRNLFESQYGVVKARVAPTVRIMLDSAEQAGLFAVAGRNRMVMPNLGPKPPSSPEAPSVPPANRIEVAPRHGGNGGNGGGSGIDLSSVHPAILGLIAAVPTPGSGLSAKRRKGLIDTFASLLTVLYPEDESENRGGS